MPHILKIPLIVICAVCLLQGQNKTPAPSVTLSVADYEDRVKAAWFGQILGTLMGFQFEHKQAAVKFVDQLPAEYQNAPADDDYFYEVVALRGFEKHGLKMNVRQLGELWKEHNIGAWGSSEQARLLIAKGIAAPDSGHPRYNKLWFSIGPQFSADLYGMIAPGMPNLAGKLAREFGHLNGFAEGTDGAVFVAGMISLGFVERDSRQVVRQAAKLLDPSSPYRQALDQVISLAEKGMPVREIAERINEKWQTEYPATNNAVANGAIVALSVWFGEGDFLQTVNVAYQAGDFTDADCNAANAGAVAGAMRGMKGIPARLVEQLHDRMQGAEMGGVPIRPPVEESITAIAKRSAAIGLQMVRANGGEVSAPSVQMRQEPVLTQAAERFQLADLTKYWNPEWQLVHAGFGGAGGGLKGLRGNTYLNGEILATYPRDEVRANYLTRTLRVPANAKLTVEVATDRGRVWQLEIFADHKKLVSKLIEGGTGAVSSGVEWQTIEVPLADFAGKETILRMYQRVLVPERLAGNAYWRNATVR